MDRRGLDPWNPDHMWADPFIATLALLIILAVSFSFRTRHARSSPPPDRVELQGQLADVILATPKVVGSLTTRTLPAGESLTALVGKTHQGWDRAVLAVHAAEHGDRALGARLAQDAPGDTGTAFRTAWTWAYEKTGRAPRSDEMKAARMALGEGYAASILEARCVAQSGGDPVPLENQAAAWVMPRLGALAGAGMLAMVLFLGGAGFLAYLAFSKAEAQPLPRFGMSGRALLIVLLGWFLTHIGSGFVVNALVALLPFLRPLFFPLVYLFHAFLGTSYLCWAEGITFGALGRRLAPGKPGRALASGLGFFALAFLAVVAVSMAISPFFHINESPQRELMELLERLKGPLAVASMFFTVAVLAPVFEELMFRGFLLPWLGERLEPKVGTRAGWILAVAVSGLTFGAMHMQPMGLPTLCTLGMVLGFAFLRTGNLLTAILVHGLWNGGIFIVLRLVG